MVASVVTVLGSGEGDVAILAQSWGMERASWKLKHWGTYICISELAYGLQLQLICAQEL